MADYHLRGPADSWEQSLRVDDGCTSRQPGCARGPVNGAVGGHASEWDPLAVVRRAMAVYAAYRIGRERAPAAIVRATGLDDLPRLSKSILSGMLQMALVVAATTAIGGLAGAAIGALFGGVGAVPGAAAGAEIGFDAGMAVLGWLGLAAIAVEVVRGIGEVTNLLQRGVVTAWEAEDAPNRQAAIEAAGEQMAQAMAHLILLVLMAIVARLSAAQALAATERAAAASGELFAMLRRSQLGAEFGAWVEANAQRLMRDPKLRLHRENVGGGGGSGESATPSQLAKSQASSGGTSASSSSPQPKAVSLREQYMGRTPGKNSRTGKQVQERLRAEGKIKEDDFTGETIFQDSEGQWHPLRDADMSHRVDAVKWWNEEGKLYGPKSQQVRDWMLDPDNYTLDHYSLNRSAGARLGLTYDPPVH